MKIPSHSCSDGFRERGRHVELAPRRHGRIGMAWGRAALARSLALSVALACATGCGTLITQVDGPLFAPGKRTFDWDEKEASPIYSGTRLSWGGVRKSAVFYVWIVDLPLSFLADTALLPLSVTQDLLSRVIGGDEEEEEILAPEATPLP